MTKVIRDKLIRKNGENIPYIENLKSEQRVIMLCLHGFAGDKDSSVIAALMDRLDEKNIGAVTFDWPAHGESEASDDSLTVEKCLEDLDTMIQRLKQNHDVPIACFATSFGGYLATIYRNENPHVFRYLILRSPALKMNKIYRSFLTNEEFDCIMQGGRITQGFDRKMDLGISFCDSLCKHDAYSQIPPHPEDMLIIQGDEDDVVDPSDTMEYAKRNGIEIVIFKGADHVYKKPGEKERIVEETLRFLDKKMVI